MPEIYYIPSGPKNLTTLFPSINWDLIQDYYIEVLTGTTVVATTPTVKVNCCCDPDGIRIDFFNALGQYDGITFQKPTITHDVEDSIYEKSISYPLQKTDTGMERFNVSSNDTYEAVTNCYDESDKDWLMELFDNTKAFIEWTSDEGEGSSYLPIIITSKSFTKQKNFGATIYPVKIQFQLANKFSVQRN
jgi:hypothetical protein